MVLSRGARRLLTIFQRMWKKCARGVFPGRQWLAKEYLRCYGKMPGVRSITRWISELVSCKLLVQQRRGPRSCVYFGQSFGHSFGQSFERASISPEPTVLTPSERKQPASSETRIQMPPKTLTNEYGRVFPNPEYLRARDALLNARERVSAARNPIAYEQAILRAVLSA